MGRWGKRHAARGWRVLAAAIGVALAGCAEPTDQAEDSNSAGLFGDVAAVPAADAVGLDSAAGQLPDAGGADSSPSDAPDQGSPCEPGAGRCVQGDHESCSAAGWQPDPCPAAAPLCLGSACAACLPGETGCAPPLSGSSTSQSVRKCNADGQGWTVTALCSKGQCLAGACADCDPGEPRCLEGKRQLCAADGKGWVDAPCTGELPLCEAGLCVLCVPNQTLCDQPLAGQKLPQLVLKCNAAGDDMQLLQTCKAPEFCNAGLCVHCVPGATRCTSGALETCDDQGTSWQATPCGASKPFCVQGECMACPPSEKFCGPAQAGGGPSLKVLLCDKAGAQGQLVQTCSDGQVCVGGACALCAPGSVKCLGSLVLSCEPSGNAYAVKAQCSLQGVGCKTGQCGCSAAGPTCAPPAAGLTVSTQVSACAASGDQAAPGPPCAAGQACQAGQCGGCIPGQTQCQGQKALQCKADGSGWQLSEDCGAVAKLCIAGQCANACDPAFANPTPWGCEFWALATENTAPTNGNPGGTANPAIPLALTLLVANPNNQPVTLTLSNRAEPLDKAFKSQTYSLQPLGSLTLQVPDPSWQQPLQGAAGTSAGPLAYRLQATLPVSVAQHNQAVGGIASADTSLLWPVNALGLQYRAVTRPQVAPETRGFVAAIATAPGVTKVTVLTSAKTLAGKGVSADPLPPLQAGDTAVRELPQGHAWLIATDAKGADLTGSLVSADQPFAVLSGNQAAPVPETTQCLFGTGTPAGGAGKCLGSAKTCFADSDCPQACCADHLEDQLRPVTFWASQFILPALQPRGATPELAVVRVVASADGTSVFTVPHLANWPVLKAGQSFEVLADQDLLVYADKPVQVVQWMTSSQLTSGKLAGDPAMAVVPPIGWLDSRATWVNPAPYKQVYLVVAAPAGAAVVVDSKPVVLASSVPGSGWQVARVPVAGAGPHQLTADRPVYAMLQGWDDGVSFLHALSWGQF